MRLRLLLLRLLRLTAFVPAFFPRPTAAAFFCRRRGRRLRFENLGPVEFDVRVVFFDPADGVLVERGTSDLHARRRPEPVQNPLASAAAVTAGMYERRSFVPAL